MKSQKVITVHDLNGTAYNLDSTSLMDTEYGYSVSRRALSSFFQNNKGKRSATSRVKVKGLGFGYVIYYSRKEVAIGCRQFAPEATATIKRWALAATQTVRATKSSVKAKAVVA